MSQNVRVERGGTQQSMHGKNLVSTSPTRWIPLVDNPKTSDIIWSLVTRLHDAEILETSLRVSAQQSKIPGYVNWSPASAATGYAGLAILDAYLDMCFPDQGWDQIGHTYLAMTKEAIQSAAQSAGLAGGLCGVAFTAWQLSRNGTRYQKMLSSIDEQLLDLVRAQIGQVAKQRHGFMCGQLDVMTGLAGIGAYFLCRTNVPEMRSTLHELARQLIAISDEADGVPHWYVPPQLIVQEHWAPLYSAGLLDSGFAHGIAGPLALLSLVKLQGEVVEEIDAGIERMASWLAHHRCDDAWGINWGTAYPIKGVGDSPRPARCAWCYGAPGIANALWLAGEALNRESYRDLALQAMEAVYRRPVPQRYIPAPGFCHGVAGLLQITLHFAQSMPLPLFQEAVQSLAGQLIELYEPDSLLGYRDHEYDERLDRPDLLNGTIGVALALLAATQDRQPTWDRLFLLS